MRLNGWIRLWIVFCAIYGIVLAVGAILLFTSVGPGQVTTAEFQRELSEQEAKLVVLNRAVEEPIRENGWIPGEKSSLSAKDIDKAIAALPDRSGKVAPGTNPFDQFDDPIDPARVLWDETMPDGFQFGVVGAATNGERKGLREAWARAANSKAVSARRQRIELSLFVWLIPCVALLVLGGAIAWVRRGFRQASLSR